MTAKEQGLSVKVGKYEVFQCEDGGVHAIRNGEYWQNLTGDKLALAMAQEIDALRSVYAEMQGVSCDGGLTMARLNDWLRRMGSPAALASDTGERGVVSDAVDTMACAATLLEQTGDPVCKREAAALREHAAALRAQPAGGGDVTCRRCKGSGEGTALHGSGPDAYEAPVTCETCDGTGTTPPESGGQGEIVAIVCYAPAFGKGFYQWVKSDAILPIGTKLYTHPPTQASGAVTEAMVTDAWGEFCCVVARDLDGRILNGREAIRAAITAALTQEPPHDR